jgi:hypothetical protein
MEQEGIEPSTSACKTDVFPLSPQPQAPCYRSRTGQRGIEPPHAGVSRVTRLHPAEGRGIEPPGYSPALVFKTSCRPFSGTFLVERQVCLPLRVSYTTRRKARDGVFTRTLPTFVEARTGVEPVYLGLQSSTLPLCHPALAPARGFEPR